MHVRRGALGWGAFLLLAGAIPLAVRAGILTETQVRDLWTLWPMILIGLGIGLLLTRTRVAFLGRLIVAATLGTMVGGLLSVALGGAGLTGGICGSPDNATTFAGQSGSFVADTAVIDVQTDCSDLQFVTAPGSGWSVTGMDEDAPKIEVAGSSLRVRSSDGQALPFFAARSTWRLSAPADIALGLRVSLSAGTAHIDLAGATIGTAVFDLNATTATVDLGSVKALHQLQVALNGGTAGITFPNLSLTGTIEANAGAARLCIPTGAGLRLETSGSVVASYDYAEHGLVKVGSVWTTPGYETAAVRIDLRTEGNAAAFTLDPSGGCDG